MKETSYRKKMEIEEAVSNLQLFFEEHKDSSSYPDSMETVLWLLSKNDIGLSEAQELYNEGFHDGYDTGYSKRLEENKHTIA